MVTVTCCFAVVGPWGRQPPGLVGVYSFRSRVTLLQVRPPGLVECVVFVSGGRGTAEAGTQDGTNLAVKTKDRGGEQFP